jgi:hypothetical protein
VIDALIAAVSCAAPRAGEWLRAELAAGAFHTAFAAAGRRVGHAAITREDARRIMDAGLLVPETMGADECARGALVLAAVAAMPAAEHVAFVRDLIRRGEVRERQAVLRVLAALPDPARFCEVAIDACRTNIVTVFEAIACDNAYPAAHVPALAFDQMVLKALFVGVALARIHGLAARNTDELARMVSAFASERRAAGRAIPDDVKLVLT